MPKGWSNNDDYNGRKIELTSTEIMNALITAKKGNKKDEDNEPTLVQDKGDGNLNEQNN